jgi:hypothetical protein
MSQIRNKLLPRAYSNDSEFTATGMNCRQACPQVCPFDIQFRDPFETLMDL